MRSRFNDRLNAIARRIAGAALADDIVQDALLIAVEQGRVDLESPETLSWLAGVVRNRARMVLRSGRRRERRERAWSDDQGGRPAEGATTTTEVLDGLSPALRTFAALVLTGHNRREIAYLLRLPDTALRQRVSALRRHLLAKGLASPEELTGLSLDLTYGRIRDALLPALLRHGGVFASHDPDGHLFVVRRSQIKPSRQ